MSADIPFPTHISNSQRSTFITCPQKWVYEKLVLQKGEPSIHLHAGAAFASGIEVVRKAFFGEDRSSDEAIALGVEQLLAAYGDHPEWESENKNSTAMAGALDAYFQNWPLHTDFIRPWAPLDSLRNGTEFTFEVPLDIKHPETGDPLLYTGRIDLLGEHSTDKTVWVLDDKTAGQLGNRWINQWALDSQPTSYIWAVKQYGVPVAGALIRGVSILKTKYGFAQAMEVRTQFELDQWYRQLLRDAAAMIATWRDFRESRPVDRKLDKAFCGMYSGCPFQTACRSPDPGPWVAALATPTANPLDEL